MRSLKDDPKKSKYNSILMGIPTFGFPSINFAISIKTEGSPIFTTVSIMSVLGKPVDVARNEIAFVAMRDEHAFVLFRDDDVIAPHNNLTKLLGRMSPAQRAKPREVCESVIGGVVYSKVQPPSPMIYLQGCAGGFEDWNFGDLVECDSIGMGDTVIPVGVFHGILNTGYDKYQCVNSECPVRWNESYKKEDENCPHCGTMLIPIFFKTVRSGEGMDEQMVEMTEDTYFCFLARDAGAKIYADCAVQCKHECSETGLQYYFHEGVGVPVWEGENGLDYYPQTRELSNSVEDKPKKTGKKNGKVKFNLGSGGVNKKGFINIDLYVESDFQSDVRDLRKVVSEYGLADEIEADHVLEHFNRMSVTTAVRNWIKALKPGGRLTFRAPDAIAAMNDFIEADKNGTKREEYEFKEAVVFGAQRYNGDQHQTAITENKMKKVISSCRNMIEDYKIDTGRRKGANQDEVVVTITKKKADKKAKKEKKNV
jgi:predicted SAM-dependent methyltransferase